MRVSYDRSHGLSGNVARGAINTSSALASGLKVSNPVPTWGGAPSEDIAEAQKQIPRFIQHRDRLVTAADFEAITLRTPGVQIGRVEVLPAFNPDLAPDALGNSPGTVTLMLVPEKDPVHPEAPEPDSLFMGTVCSYLDARRLVTTELILRGPDYRDIWIAVGIELLATGGSGSEVRDAVRRRIREFLAPVRRSGLGGTDLMTNPDSADTQKGWPLRRAVSAAELMAEATRVPGVRFVRKVRLAGADGIEAAEIPMQSLQLPRIAGLSVVVGDAPDPASLMGGVVQETTGGDSLPNRRVVPVPVIPDRC
jgi:predicted phage baseplate assembly protein